MCLPAVSFYICLMTIFLKYFHLGSLQIIPSLSKEKEIMRSSGPYSLVLKDHSAQITHLLTFLSLWETLLRKFTTIK